MHDTDQPCKWTIRINVVVNQFSKYVLEHCIRIDIKMKSHISIEKDLKVKYNN